MSHHDVTTQKALSLIIHFSFCLLAPSISKNQRSNEHRRGRREEGVSCMTLGTIRIIMPHIRIRGRWRGLAKFPSHFPVWLRMQPNQRWVVCCCPHYYCLMFSWPLSAGGLPCCVVKLLFIPRIYFLSLLVLRPFRSSDKSNFHPGLATSTSPPRSTRRRSSCTRRRSGWIARTMSTTPIEGESVVGLIR